MGDSQPCPHTAMLLTHLLPCTQSGQQINTIITRHLQPLRDDGCSGAAGIQIHSSRPSFLLLFHHAAARSRNRGSVWLRALSLPPCTLDGYSWMSPSDARTRLPGQHRDTRGLSPAVPGASSAVLPRALRGPLLHSSLTGSGGCQPAPSPRNLSGKGHPSLRNPPVPAASEPSAALPCTPLSHPCAPEQPAGSGAGTAALHRSGCLSPCLCLGLSARPGPAPLGRALLSRH